MRTEDVSISVPSFPAVQCAPCRAAQHQAGGGACAGQVTGISHFLGG